MKKNKRQVQKRDCKNSLEKQLNCALWYSWVNILGNVTTTVPGYLLLATVGNMLWCYTDLSSVSVWLYYVLPCLLCYYTTKPACDQFFPKFIMQLGSWGTRDSFSAFPKEDQKVRGGGNSLPLVARSCRKRRKEKSLHPQESWGTWTVLCTRESSSAPYFLLCSWAYTGIWMTRERYYFLCQTAALLQKANTQISAWSELPDKRGFNPFPMGEKFHCDSPSCFRNGIIQLVIKEHWFLGSVRRSQDEPQWSVIRNHTNRWYLLPSGSVTCSKNINTWSDLKEVWASKSSENTKQCIRNEMAQ